MDRSELAMVLEGLERILADAPIERIDAEGGAGVESEALWSVLCENGYPLLCVPINKGGFGGAIAELAEIATLIGSYALPLPLIDTILARSLLSLGSDEQPNLRIAIATSADAGAMIPHAGQAQALMTFQKEALVCVELDQTRIETAPGAEDGAGRVDGAIMGILGKEPAHPFLNGDALDTLGAFTRAALMAGAMQAVLDLTLSYTQEREQFGRPLSKFQAIQHHLSDIACETAASIAAVELATDAVSADPALGSPTIEAIAIAKIRAGEAASRVTAAAHQAHGAMGFTREYALGRYTRRLWQWQDEFGSDAEWSIKLGHAVLADQKPALWPRLSQPI